MVMSGLMFMELAPKHQLACQARLTRPISRVVPTARS